MNALPGLCSFLFDFSEPHKIDLERFMLSNYQFNVPVEKFTQLTGRSLAGFKRDFQRTFNLPRQWLLDRWLNEAKHLIETKHQKPSGFYLDLGFETISHFSSPFKKKFGKAPTAYYSVSTVIQSHNSDPQMVADAIARRLPAGQGCVKTFK